MDTKLTDVSVSFKKITQLDSLKTDNIRGFTYFEDGSFYVVSINPLTDLEKSDLISSINALPDEYSKTHIERAFNWRIFSGRLAEVMLISSVIKLSQFLSTLQGMCEWPNFQGVKGLLTALVSQSIMTQDECDQLSGCLLEQGIDLSSY